MNKKRGTDDSGSPWQGRTTQMLRHTPPMPRLSIDISAEEHKKLKAIAALKGQSLKDYVLEKTLGEAPPTDGMTEQEALAALGDALKESLAQADRGEYSQRSYEDIRQAAKRRAGH